jgi:hypothetical protein
MLRNIFISYLLPTIILSFCSYSIYAKIPSHYGRIYNVQDYIDKSGGNATLGMIRCFSEVTEKIYNSSASLGCSTAVYFTIIIPNGLYNIDSVIMPYIKMDTIPTYRKKIIRPNCPSGINYGEITLNIIGLNIRNTKVKQVIGATFKDSIWNNYYGSNYVSSNFTNNGVVEDSDIKLFLDKNLARVNMQCNKNPASAHFLQYQPDSMPLLRSYNKKAHSFFSIMTVGDNTTEPYIYDPNKKLRNFTVNISGLHMVGINDTTNTNVYNAVSPSKQHDSLFKTGIAVHVENFQSIIIDNLFIENIYGNGIYVNNFMFPWLNDSCNISENIILNTWALNYKYNYVSFDDNGDAIFSRGIQNGISNYNFIKNDLSVTHQYGRLGLGTCCEHNKNCTAEFNYISGYDRDIHIENGRGGFKVRFNRIVGSETGLVMDGIRTYLKHYDTLAQGQSFIECDPSNPTLIEYNYISNEELTQVDSLMKIYPPFLVHAYGMNYSNTYNKTEFKNNYLNLDINKIPKNYKKTILYLDTVSNTFKNPKPYYALAGWNKRTHLFSGIKQQLADCNTFNTINTGDTSLDKHGGIFLNTYKMGDLLDTIGNNPFPRHCDTSEFVGFNSNSNTIPLKCRNNTFKNCYKVEIRNPASSTNFVYGNSFAGINNMNASTGDSTYFAKPDLLYPPYNCTLIPKNNDYCNGKPLLMDADYFWNDTTLTGVLNINNKTIVVNGHVILNDNVTLTNSSIYFTTGAKLTLSDSIILIIYNNCLLQSACDGMWDGIYADNTNSQILIANSTVKNMENGIQAYNNSQLTVNKTNFENNFVSIKIIGNIDMNRVTITENKFYSNAIPLLEPHVNELPQHGIYVSNCEQLFIGNDSAIGEPNLFNKLSNGIFIERINPCFVIPPPPSSIICSFNKFTNIQNSPSILNAHYGSAIFGAHQNAGTDLFITITNPISYADSVMYSNCTQGIRLKYVSCFIKNQSMFDGAHGIFISEADGQKITISNNNITKYRTGISKYGDEADFGFIVFNNKIVLDNTGNNYLGNLFMPRGINSNYSSINATGQSIIQNNKIYIPNGKNGIGISLQRGTGDAIINNHVAFTSNSVDNQVSVPKMIGIFSQESISPTISGNIIDNNHSENNALTNYVATNNAGIYLENNNYSLLQCNTMNYTKYGVFAVGKNGSDTVYDRTVGNYMNNSSANFLFFELQGDGTLGQIGNSQFQYNFDANNLFYEPYDINPNMDTMLLNKVFRVTTCLGTINDKIVTSSSKLVQIRSTSSDTNTISCKVNVDNPQTFNDAFNCNTPPSIIGDVVVDPNFASHVVDGTITYTDFYTIAKQADEELVYTWLAKNGTIRSQYPILDSFYLSRFLSETGQLKRVDDAIALLSDSTLRLSPIDWQNAYNTAISLNDAISSSEIFATNAKMINAYYLKKLLCTPIDFTPEEWNDIETIAQACPYTYGNAVHRARVLYSSYNPDAHFDNLEICNSQGVYKNGLSKLNQQLAGLTEYANNKNKSVKKQTEIIIYPNPNGGILNIASTGVTKLTIYNILGNKVFQMHLNPERELNTVKLNQLTPGLYLIKVENFNNEIFTSKIYFQN